MQPLTTNYCPKGHQCLGHAPYVYTTICSHGYLFYRKTPLSYTHGKLISQALLVYLSMPDSFHLPLGLLLQYGSHFCLSTQKHAYSNNISAQKTHIWPWNKRKSFLELDQSCWPHSLFVSDWPKYQHLPFTWTMKYTGFLLGDFWERLISDKMDGWS